MFEVTPDLVRQLVADILRHSVIDEVDLMHCVRPLMAAVQRHGLPRARVPAHILELYAVARGAVNRIVAERARGHRWLGSRCPATDAAMLDDPEMLFALYPETD
jgi:hypothetical protein